MDYLKNSTCDRGEKKVTYLFSRMIHKPSKKVFFTLLLSFIVLFFIAFFQKPLIEREWAATASQAASSACSTVPFYCLIMGPGGGKGCARPSYCPLPPAASNKFSPTTNCPPAILTTKLTIHFDTAAGAVNGYTIRSVDMPSLDKFATALKQYPKAVVTINGYTDSVPFAAGTTGPINNNQTLSVARAQAAEKYLKSQGATANKYVITGYGATHFVAPNNSQSGNILNRRDEITTNLNANVCSKSTRTTLSGSFIMSNVTAYSNNGTGDYCLTDVGGHTAVGSKVGIGKCSTSDQNQHWEATENGAITVNGKCLGVANKQATNGSKVGLYTCDASTSQQWNFQKINSGPAIGQTEIVNAKSGQCLEDPNFSIASGMQQQLATCNGTDNQSWFNNPKAIGSQLTCKKNDASAPYYAGYVFTAPKSAKKVTVSGSWVVSAFTCRNGDYGYSEWPGIGNYKNGQLAQVGTYNLCQGTTPTYNPPWTMAYPGPFVNPPASDTIQVHDIIYASVSMIKPGKFNTVLTDKTQGWTYKRTMSYNTTNWTADYNGLILESEGNSAHVVDPANNPILPMPKFDDSYFSNATYSINGSASKPLGNAPGLTCYLSGNAQNGRFFTEDNTSPIRKNNFYVTWRNYL